MRFVVDTPSEQSPAERAFTDGIAATHSGDTARAIERLAQAEALGHPEAAFELGLFLGDLGRYRDARAALERAVAGGDLDAGVSLANLLADHLGQPERALEIYRDDGGRTARHNEAILLIELGRADEAINRLSTFSDGDAETLLHLGQAFEAKGDHARALDYYNAAGETVPLAHVYRAGLLAEDGDLVTAEAAYRQAISLGVADCAQYLGALLVDQERLDEAEVVYASALADGDETVLLNFGVLLSDTPGRQTDAVDLYERAIADGEPLAHLNLALLLEELDRSDEAEAQYQMALASGDDDAYRPYLRFLLGRCRFETAEALARAEARAGDEAALDVLVELYTEIGEHRRAVNLRDQGEQPN